MLPDDVCIKKQNKKKNSLKACKSLKAQYYENLSLIQQHVS